jgi:hypothetical protein
VKGRAAHARLGFSLFPLHESALRQTKSCGTCLQANSPLEIFEYAKHFSSINRRLRSAAMPGMANKKAARRPLGPLTPGAA